MPSNLFSRYVPPPLTVKIVRPGKTPQKGTFDIYRVSCAAKYGTKGRTNGAPYSGN